MFEYVNAKDIRIFVSIIGQMLVDFQNLETAVDAWDPILLGILQ